jgi:hypothetical protein
MAAREVIHFPSWAQLASRPLSPARIPPEPIALSSPLAEFALHWLSPRCVSGAHFSWLKRYRSVPAVCHIRGVGWAISTLLRARQIVSVEDWRLDRGLVESSSQSEGCQGMRTELERFATAGKRTLANFGAALLECGFEQ